MILILDTSAENVFIGSWNEDKSEWITKEEFLGGRKLNSMIIHKLDLVLGDSWDKVTGIIIAAGPGSYTGLRIGMSVANTLAYTQNIPIVAPIKTENYKELLQKGQHMLESAGSQFQAAVTPHYGAEPHITKPKH
jgi:tRNA A37 threonylcarbamoyladenosine modification protein TsaB